MILGLRQVSSSTPSPDLVSRGMQPHTEPPARLQPQVDSINLSQQYPKQQLVSEKSQLSRPHLGPSNPVQDHNLGKAQGPLQSQYLNGGGQNVPSISQGLSHAQNKSTSLVSRPTSSTFEEETNLSRQSTPQIISRDEFQHDGTIASTGSRISRATSTEAADINSKHSAANFNAHLQENPNSPGSDQSAAILLPLDHRAISQLKAAPDAPRLPRPDVGGLFREGWDDQGELTASQVAKLQHSQSQSTSNSMSHDRVNTEQPRGISQNGNLEKSYQFLSGPNEPFKDEPSPDQGAPPTAQPSFLADDHAQNSKHRPFSFMELSSHKTHEPVQEILQHVRREEAKPSGDRYDRDPSPVSSQRSLHDLRNQHSQTNPAQSYASDDFVPSEKQLELATQSSSYPFQDPNLHEHPAFRLGASSVDKSSLRTDHVPAETLRRTSGAQQQQSPPAVPPHGVIANSWRNSREPPSLPALSGPNRAGGPTPTTKSRYEDPQLKQSIAPKIKAKRASLFRSLNGRSGKDRDPGRNTQEIIASPPATRIGPKNMSSHHENTKIDTGTSESSKARNKLQRLSTSASPEQDSGKKKRFSVLGVSLF